MDSRKITDVHNSKVYDNFLIHWKYIKREKIPGAKKGEKQWKYWYKDDEKRSNSAKETAQNTLDDLIDGVKKKSEKSKTILDNAAKSAKAMIENASSSTTKQTASHDIKNTVENGKQSASKLIKDISDKSTEEINSLGVHAALFAGTLVSKVVSKVNHEAGEKVEQKVTEIRSDKSREEAAKNGFVNEELSKNDPLPTLPVKTEATTSDEDMAAINPKYSRGTYAYTNNCSYCTAAYDLRARGYDVEADAISKHDQSTIAENIASWYDGEEIKPFSVANSGVGPEEAAKQLETELISHGDGARGHLMMYWWFGGGHDVIWEVEHGNVVIRDCQSNEKLEVIDYLQYTRDGMYFRTDNIQPNEKILETVKSRKR